jgi:DNA-binding transcriptional regulator YbjK
MTNKWMEIREDAKRQAISNFKKLATEYGIPMPSTAYMKGWDDGRVDAFEKMMKWLEEQLRLRRKQ